MQMGQQVSTSGRAEETGASCGCGVTCVAVVSLGRSCELWGSGLGWQRQMEPLGAMWTRSCLLLSRGLVGHKDWVRNFLVASVTVENLEAFFWWMFPFRRLSYLQLWWVAAMRWRSGLYQCAASPLLVQ